MCTTRFWVFLLVLVPLLIIVNGNEDAKRLYDDLMVNYNRHRRPSTSPNKPLTIKLKLRLSQIIDVHEIDQIMTCSVWLKQTWIDRKLSWDPVNYGGVNVLYVPYEMIWVPDIVLYNNADSNYNITISTKATLHYTGEVTWEPPAIFKSMCQIDVRWFPFDEQQCHLKFGSWTFSENLLSVELNEPSLRFEEEIDEKGIVDNVTVADDGIDLSDYYPSVEWDIMSRVAKRRAKNYPSCCPQSAYIDVTYYLQLRRKPLFYTVNLVFPCVGISFLTILVFYLPSDSGEKVTLCISILVALTIFFLLLTEIIPATSITLPLIGKYLLFTMVMVTLSVVVTVVLSKDVGHKLKNATIDDTIQKMYYSPPVVKAFENICFIAELLKKKDRDDKIDEDWKYVAMVLDRLFLLIFSIACFVGTVIILLRAPTLYDTRSPIDLQYRPANLSANPISV
ncbi:hypothetical protein CAEBREN_23742 [Caenorhabditis brenneri]|uniref:Uncharacterized protein n=1 Tax=Caenorhabditis brenneri TaxID=135651 RepID=G0P3J3_CAEBE|nr:hypothetical protein CAEBREN_23742 [Caenorhabditis brenneri]